MDTIDRSRFDKIMSTLASIGVTVATAGQGYLRYEERILKSDLKGHPLEFMV